MKKNQEINITSFLISSIADIFGSKFNHIHTVHTRRWDWQKNSRNRNKNYCSIRAIAIAFPNVSFTLHNFSVALFSYSVDCCKRRIHITQTLTSAAPLFTFIRHTINHFSVDRLQNLVINAKRNHNTKRSSLLANDVYKWLLLLIFTVVK